MDDGKVKELEAKVARLTEALKDAAAHLAGATSAYKAYARRHKSVQRGKPVADPFYTTRIQDFEKATDRARNALLQETSVT